MKLHLPLRLLSALLAAVGVVSTSAISYAADDYTPSADLGNVMYVGDSITHGYGAASYRWALFKILTDNGIAQNEVGVATGNNKNGVAAGATYGTGTFENVHSSWSSERAWEISGRTNTSGRLGNSNILDWLGLDSSYTGTYQIDTETEMPDTFFLMIGTNDLLSDTGSNKHVSQQSGAYFARVQQNLIGLKTELDAETNTWKEVGWVDTTAASAAHRPDMDVIVDSMKEANPNAEIVLTTIPTWSSTHSNNNYAEDYRLVSEYNANLKRWVERKNADGANITLVDVNEGLIDVAETEKPASAQASMFYDGLHPSYHGDLIVAGNIARSLGYAGRTAGQERMAAADFSIQLDAQGGLLAEGGSLVIALANAESISYSWAEGTDLSDGYTLDFSFTSGLGNGETDGWVKTDFFSVSLGDGVTGGTLNISEAYIKWDDTLLYSMDTSTLGTGADDALRVSFVNGNNLKGLDGGYYIWMGDMLIGEALSGSSTELNGLSITNNTGSDVLLDHLSVDNHSWAPTSERYVNPENPNPLIGALGDDVVAGPGTAVWPEPDSDPSITAITMTGTTVNTFLDNSGATSGDVCVTIEGNSSSTSVKTVFANSSDYTGDVYVTLTGQQVRGRSDGYNAAHASGTLTGKIALRIDSDFQSDSDWNVFLGAANGTVTEDVYLEFSSVYLKASGDKFTTNNVATHLAIGGTYKANVQGNLSLVFNSGLYQNAVYGGEVGDDGYTIGGDVSIYVNEATVQGNVYGGGAYGIIRGDASVHVTGDAGVTGALISAGGTGGSIEGNSLVTISDVGADSSFAASFKGTLCGGTNVGKTRTLLLNNVTALQATTIQNFDAISVEGDSVVELADQTDVKALNTGVTSDVTLKGGEYTELLLGNSGTLKLTQGVSVQVRSVADDNLGGTFEIKEGSTLDAGGTSMYASTAMLESGSLKNYDGRVMIEARGDVSLSGVDASQIQSLNLYESCQVTGLSGELHLAEASVMLSLASQSEAEVALVLEGEGSCLAISGTLTLNLDQELSQYLVDAAAEEEGGATFMSLSTADRLLLSQGEMVVVDGAIVSVNLADGFEDYIVADAAVAYDETDGCSYLTYTLSKAVPEPTTATLSLMALAALAARRRRRG